MQQIVNRVYAPLFNDRRRYTLLMGGRGAGRSTVESQYILAKLLAPEYFRCAMMRFVLSDIRNSAFRELKDRAEDAGVLDKLVINESQMTISHGKNTVIAHGFRKSSGDQSAKLKSLANYNHVWVEEADEVPEEDFVQLDDSLRTMKGDIHIHLTLNPPSKNHWIIRRWVDLSTSEVPMFYVPTSTHPDVLFINTSWKDNAKNIDIATQRRYEEYRDTKPDHYWNMIRGYVPEVLKGRIYSDWKKITEIPHTARLLGYGLDFGFDPDPASIVGVYYHDGGYILDEVVYQTKLDNEALATIIKNNKQAPVFCDSAEPKSIVEMRKYDVDVHPCEKGPDSVRFGIKYVQGLRISYTARSLNLEREYENYAWKVSKDGEELPMPDPKCSEHALDATRYGLTSLTTSIQGHDVEKKQVIMNQRQYVSNIVYDAGL